MNAHRISKSERAAAEALVREWKESGASNRYAADEANILLTALALSAHRMTIAPAPLAERREAVLTGAVESFTRDWDALVIGVTTPNVKVQRRLMSALALAGANVRLDWVRIESEWFIVRTG